MLMSRVVGSVPAGALKKMLFEPPAPDCANAIT